MKRSGMLTRPAAKLSPVTEMHLKYKLQFNSLPRNCIKLLLVAVDFSPVNLWSAIQLSLFYLTRISNLYPYSPIVD
jgi:hypothetical protein